MSYARKVDANHREIVGVFLAMGASVASLAALGAGVPDLLVGYCGKNYLVEVKDGEKPPSQRKLTPAQQKFHAAWLGSVRIVESVDQAIDLVSCWRAAK